MSVIDLLIGLLAPYECVGCAAEGSLLCVVCIKQLPKAEETAQNVTCSLESLRSAAKYTGLAKDLVWKLKSAGAQAAVGPMATLMLPLLNGDETLIIPVPTATGRVRGRGYDQARLLARELARRSGLPYLDCLARYGQTHQVGAGRQQRLSQLSGALRVRKSSKLRGRQVMLVDDVATTGATLEAAASVLLKAGATRVSAVTFAQA